MNDEPPAKPNPASTPGTEPDPSPPPPPAAPRWIGVCFLVLGATVLGVFTIRQITEWGRAHTYFEYIGWGLLSLMVGLAFVAATRPRKKLADSRGGPAQGAAERAAPAETRVRNI